MTRIGLQAPVNLTWEITLKCNLRCAHCLSDSGITATDELSQLECLKLVDELTALKVFQVNIGGGEPFLHNDFLDLVIDNDLAKRLAKLKMLYLQVSLDGATEEVNDHIRGKGTYKKILRAIDCLAKNDVAFSINTVLTKLNYPQLDTLRVLAREYGAQLRVTRFRPAGRGKDSRDNLAPHKDQLEAFAGWLDGHRLVRTGDSFFCLTSENRRRKGLDMCGAAKMTCCISPNGDVYPCAFMQEQPFLVGNIRTTGLKNMWNHSPVFNQFRNLNVQSCQTCSRFESCRGGCPAMAYHSYNDLDMPDPECLINLKKAA
jgi:mycofactocin radical SAM maturase